MKKIVFFNYAHRGDVFISRPFIDQIMSSVDAEFYYAHYWGEYLLKDLNLKYLSLDEVPKIRSNNEHADNFIHEDVVYINTWIGKYASVATPGYCECNLKTLYSLVYTEIIQFISKELDVNIELKPIEKYLECNIDYSYFNISGIDEFLNGEKRRRVLLCNGPALSGQCEYNGDMSEIVEHLAKKYNDIVFITTHKIDLELENVKYTGNIIKAENSDLNEISYLSTFCDIIVGRSSGPFTFANVKENIFDDNKAFLCFGEREKDCLPYELNISCEFIFQKFTIGSELSEITDTIVELIEK